MSLLDRIGNTPLREIPYPKSDKVRVFAKLEWCNPSGSVKDRAAANMIQDALEKGQLEGKTLIDATSGNTGIAYAMLGASLGIPIELALPENASKERQLILRNYGAKIHLTSAMEATDGSQRFVEQLVNENPDKYFYPDQYNNPNNWGVHVKTTGPEIWRQTDEKITHFIAGLGTTGTFVGTSRYLQPKGVTCISVQPNTPMHGLEGWKHMETAIVPGIYDNTIADSTMTADTEQAFRLAKAASKYLGLMLSPSAAANLSVAFDLADQIGSGTIVTTFADNGMKYLQDAFWTNDDYNISNPFI
ncbi:cysteine synthase family protein [bacterium]|jgi:S-sulfo-L-cysteine synthase (O-acetyl-L-serine-dependent)|nr:cysteine synthase family protein [bacterium]